MIHKKSTFFLGIFMFLIPFTGFPSSWKSFFVIVCGLTLISLSIKISIPKRGFKGRQKREKVTPVFVENIPIYPRDSHSQIDLESNRNRDKNVME